jgi:HD-GYP domain-containing protein (c-di-GMP phosphodiesterase class II)
MTSISLDELNLLQEYFEETTSRGILLIDQEGMVKFANPQFYHFFQIDSDFVFREMSLVDCVDFLELSIKTLENQEKFSSMMQPFLEGREHMIRLFLEPDVWVTVSGKPIKNGGFVISVTDVTQTRQAFDVLKRTNRATIMALADLAENRDHDTGAHVLKVARMTQEIAWELQNADKDLSQKIDDKFMQHVALASVLHDVGKVTIPDRILLKTGPLDTQERQEMNRHSKVGHDIIAKMSDFQESSYCLNMASNISLSHHEKFDGGGYPQGISGNDIPLEARIVAVSDVFDALVSWRPYKQPWSEEKAVNLIRKSAGKGC